MDVRYQRSVAQAAEWAELLKAIAEENQSKEETLSKRNGADMRNLQDRYGEDVALASVPARSVGKLV